MKIGINAIMLSGPMSGSVRRIINLAYSLASLGHEITLYTSKWGGLALPPHKGVTVKPLAIPHQPAYLRTLGERLLIPQHARRDLLDLIEWSHFPVVPVSGIPHLVTIHDLRHLSIPKYSAASRKLLGKKVYQSAVEGAKKVIAVSDFTRGEILRHLDVPEENVVVVPNAADHLPEMQAIPSASGRDKTILCFGHLEPRKNLLMLLEGFAIFLNKGFRHLLQIAGREKGDYFEQMFNKAKALGIDENIEWIPHVEDDTLPSLYAKAQMFVFPSLYEGFGIPLLEAMRFGCPVLSSNASALPEIGGEACWYADPKDAKEWAEKMEFLAEDMMKREELAERGKQREAGFRWRGAGEIFAEILS